jgi:hypothetical protein
MINAQDLNLFPLDTIRNDIGYAVNDEFVYTPHSSFPTHLRMILQLIHREANVLRQPSWPQALPDDIDYGQSSQLCLDDTTWPAKPQAIDAFRTQLGTVGRTQGVLAESREGILDCAGYLRSFGRRTEVFVVKRFPE